jgi:broad-specificity NMP kinase
MKKIIQIIGLPGIGKSTAIKRYLKKSQVACIHLDLAKYTGNNKEDCFKKAIKQATIPVIAESACGVEIKSTIIKVTGSIQHIYQQLLKRDKVLDEDYLSLLSTNMQKANITTTSNNLEVVLLNLLE